MEAPSATNPYETAYLPVVWRNEAERAKAKQAMSPFFRGTDVTQPSASRDWPGGRIEGFSTTGENKRERTPMFSPEDGRTGWVTGMPNVTDFLRCREVPSRIMNNAAPEPQRVGRGLGLGANDPATGGFHQFEARDYAIDRGVDELRVASKPKTTELEARLVAGGAAVTERGQIGTVAKNRTPKTWETGEQYFFTTTGSRVAHTAESAATTLDRCTVRECTGDTGGQGGPLGPASGAGAHTAPDESAGAPRRDEPAEPDDLGLANARRDGRSAGSCDDYGKASVQVYANERDITTCQTVKTNLQSIVKAITAPLQDLFRDTRKVFTLEASREHGQLQPRMPAKMTVYDPNDRLRTTIKETLIHDAVRMNLRGNTTVITYDPDYLVAKTTIRETVESVNPHRNMRPPTLKLTLIDPDDRAKTTVKETALAGYRPGGPEREGGLGYLAQEWDARMTQRANIDPDTDYGGNPGHDRGGGYDPEVNPIDPTNVATQRSMDTVDPAHVGGLFGATELRPTSDEAAHAAYVNTTRDGVLARRDPTKVNVMLSKGTDWVRMQPSAKAPPCAGRTTPGTGRGSAPPEKPVACAAGTRDRSRLMVDTDAWMDPSLLDAFRANPYTQSLQSF